MKKIKWMGLFLFSAVLFACGGNANSSEEKDSSTTETTEKTEKDVLEGMEMLDLSDYDIDASIYVPGADNGKPMVHATDWGSVEISIGKRYGVEIVPFGMTITEKKAELSDDLMYTIEYLEEDANHIVYQKSIADSDVETEVHFFLTVDMNGDVYEVKSMTDQTYNKKAIEKMIQSAKTLSAKGAT